MTTVNAPGVRMVRDLVLLLARIGLGIIMIAHAKLMWDFGGGTLSGVGALWAQSGGVPLPSITGPANLLFEFVGGVAMIVGLGVPIVGVVMAVNMVGAWVFVHTAPLFSMDHNGPELVIMIALLSLVLAVVGSGRFGLDHLIGARRRAGVAVSR
jgi:putative oxidoreductase